MAVKSTFKLPSLESVAEKIAEKPKEVIASETFNTPPVIQDLVLEEVQKIWNMLAKSKEVQGKINEHILLNNRKLEIEGHIVRFSVDNAFQADYLGVFKNELIEYLREKTGHPNVNIEYTVEKREDKPPNIYTPTEKYNYLSLKYPILSDLRQKLGLELDF